MKEEREEKKVIDAGKRKKEVRLAAELLRWQCITAEPRQGREAHALQAPPGFSAAIWPVKRVQYHGGSVIFLHHTWAQNASMHYQMSTGQRVIHCLWLSWC